MTARLLPRGKLVDLLFRAVRGEPREDIARFYDLTWKQVTNLINTHRAQYRHIEHLWAGNPARMVFGTLRPIAPKPNVIKGFWKKCNRCYDEFWTESRFIFSCDKCHDRADFKSGADYSTAGVRWVG